ncbi:ATPase [Pseudoroseomonas wenyumeiae]|uniref:ATPase n=1 Tax=Teichococcus wenyumeiae TaxID=2478470 RepID=A0A3A9JM76_9PROT|nr:ATPase [Pseudoroseomonas wenyumeiae]RMI15134.1 ATPase [Pseudoroseomonas wenyumeiae]
MQDQSRFFVVTGGPGSGKSTLIEALKACGLRTMPEAGRAVIQDQVTIGGSALPWDDRLGFAELMLGWELRSHREARDHVGVVLFDRGIPDLLGYLTLCGLPVPPHVQQAAHTFRYNRRVFIAPPWPEIFGQDAERKQSPEEAQATYKAMVDAYTGYGYELIHLPKSPVEDRVRFVLAELG